jgi:hypothetical protein
VFYNSKFKIIYQVTQLRFGLLRPTTTKSGKSGVYEKVMKDIVKSMDKHGIKRYVHIGGAVHMGRENENWPMNRRFLRFFLSLFSKPILIAKQLEWEVLKSSDLDWTLVRPPKIANEETLGKLTADEKNLYSLQVSVGDLTDFILEQITLKEWILKAPLVSSRKK